MSEVAAAEGVKRAGERGAVAVEFALVLPLLAMLMFGIVTFGLAYNDHLALTNAVREASRFGATAVNEATWAPSVIDRAQAVYLNGSRSLSDSEICAQLLEQKTAASPGGSQETKQQTLSCAVSGPPDVPDGVQPGECIVRVWAATPAKLNIVLASWDITIGARSLSYYERTPCVPPATP